MAALTNHEPNRADGWSDESFMAFYNRHRGLVRQRVRSVVSARDVDDVVQEVFLRLYRKRHTYRGETPIEGWVGVIAHNTSLMHLRLARVRRERVIGDETVHFLIDSAGTRPSLTRELRARRALADVRENLPRLEEDQRRILELGGEGCSMREIADELDVTVACAKSRLYRARQELRGMLPTRLEELP